MTIIQIFDGMELRSTEALEQVTFAGGEPHVNVQDPTALRGGDFVIAIAGGSFQELGMALVANDALRRHNAKRVTLFAPYLPGARQDRPAPLTAKVYADIINAANFNAVICVDPHSPVMPALLDRCYTIDPAPVVPAQMFATTGPAAVVICPDAGAAKRAESVASFAGLDVIYARKHRNPRTGGLGGFSCEALPGDAIGVVIDDICDGGATFLGLADAIGVERSRLRLWTTHGIYSKGLEALRERYGLIGATDSFASTSVPDITQALQPWLITALKELHHA